MVVMIVGMGVIVPVPVIVPVIVPVVMVGCVEVVPVPVFMAVCAGLAVQRRWLGTSANRAHQITSISLIRISSPPCGNSRPPPHSGQGASRWSRSTVPAQS